VVRALRGYADGSGRSSNRQARPACVTRHPRLLPADRSCRLWTRALAPPNQSRSILMRLSNSAQPGISCAPTLTTATSAGVGHLDPSDSPPASRRVGHSRAPLGVSPRPVGIPLQWSILGTISLCTGRGTVSASRRGFSHLCRLPCWRGRVWIRGPYLLIYI